MLINITRGRFGWQKPGCACIRVVRPGDGAIDVPEATAKRLVSLGVAELAAPSVKKTPAPAPAAPADAPDYGSMTRAELNALAKEAGIKGASKMANKGAVIAALKEHGL